MCIKCYYMTCGNTYKFGRTFLAQLMKQSQDCTIYVYKVLLHDVVIHYKFGRTFLAELMKQSQDCTIYVYKVLLHDMW